MNATPGTPPRRPRTPAVVALAVVGAIAGSPAVAVAAPASAGPPVATPRITLRAAPGFFDDAWALDTAGRRLAVIQTDRDSFQRLTIFDLDASAPSRTAGGSPLGTFELPPPAHALHALMFSPLGSGLLLVSEGEPGGYLIESINDVGKSQGKSQEKTGPVTDFGLATIDGKTPVLVVLERRAARNGEVTQVVTPLRLPSLKPASKARTYVLTAEGMLRTPPLIPVGFFDGYSKLLAQRPGWFDKKKDVRQPDGQSVLDLLTGKLVADAPISDVYGWARTTRLRRERPNRTAFIQLADATGSGGTAAGQSVGSGIELVDPQGRLAPVPLAVPLRLYDRFTLKDQEGPEPGLIHFGLQVDPVNSDAVARKKADLPFLDVYTAPVAHPEASRLRARVALDAQPAVWSIAGNRLVVFRRFKSFARGGDRIDVYDITP